MKTTRSQNLLAAVLVGTLAWGLTVGPAACAAGTRMIDAGIVTQ